MSVLTLVYSNVSPYLILTCPALSCPVLLVFPISNEWFWLMSLVQSVSKSACSSQKFCACVFLCPAVFQLVCHIPFSIQPNFLSLAVSVSLQAAVEDRLKLLQEAHRDFGPSSQHFLSSESKHMNKFTVSCQLYFTGLQCSLKSLWYLPRQTLLLQPLLKRPAWVLHG